MKKTILILTLVSAISFTALASVTYDSPEEIIKRIQFEMKHK